MFSTVHLSSCLQCRPVWQCVPMHPVYVCELPDADRTCVWLSWMQRLATDAMHSGTILLLVDACRVKPPVALGARDAAGGYAG
jgi:hypothetical protein